MNRWSIVVEIDELVLHDFDPHDRGRIGDAVQAELQALLIGTQAANPVPRSVDQVDAGHFQVRRAEPRHVGQLAAQALHRSIF